MKKIYYIFALIFMSIPSVFAHTGEIADEPYFHMMDWHWGSGMFSNMGIFGWLFLLNWIVWLGVGVLALAWLWQKINKK